MVGLDGVHVEKVERDEGLLTADGVPIAVIHTWLPAPPFSSLTAEDLHDASLHAILGEKFGVHITSGKRQIRAVPGDAALLRPLQLKPASPVLLLEGTSFDQHGQPVEVFSTWHHPDQVMFDIDIEREPSAPAGTIGQPPSSAVGGSLSDVADRARQLVLISSVWRMSSPAPLTRSSEPIEIGPMLHKRRSL